MTKGSSPLPSRDFGFVETHRIHMGLESVPTVLSYYTSKSQSNSKLLIGHVDGVVSILEIGKQTRYPFAGKRKVRGSLIHIKISELRATNQMRSYRGHNDPVKDIQFLGGNRNLILSASRDVKFSLFCEDYTGISESFIISLPKVKTYK
jgi:WD40 repeat protein